jgi:protein subunit release factor B
MADGREERLRRRMELLGLREEDLEESFVRSGGHGGQNVNKTATCVMLCHRPTGLRVKCQDSRQQGLNRLLAREWLVEKIEEQRAAAVRAREEELAKRRRARRRPSPAVKARVKVAKVRRSSTKALRRRPGEE